MGMERALFGSAVYAVFEDRGRVLLMRRDGSGYRDGELSLPAGHLDGGEDAITGLRRELREELGVEVEPGACRLALMLHRAAESPDDCEYIDFIFTVAEWRGTPIIGEPAKCSELIWVDPSRLPDDVVDYIVVTLNAIRAGESLVLLGWDRARSR
jgi:8-oxo-dGTP diphosphatase